MYEYRTPFDFINDFFLSLSFANFSTISVQYMLWTISFSILKIDNADIFFHLPKMSLNSFNYFGYRERSFTTRVEHIR